MAIIVSIISLSLSFVNRITWAERKFCILFSTRKNPVDGLSLRGPGRI